MRSFTGSCKCGDITYRVSGKVRSVVNCHCGLCRKINGSAFSTYVAVADDDFEILQGEPRNNRISSNAEKNFCGNCGTPLFNRNPKYAGLTILHLGSIDEPLGLAPTYNIYTESKLDWLESIPDITSLEQGF